MPAQKKIEQLESLNKKLQEAKSVVLVDYRGLTHQQLADLRAKLKESGSFLMITKNTLLRLALKNPDYELSGPTAALFILDDPIPPLKALNEFTKQFKLPEIKIGILEGEITEKEKIIRLANLPSKEILQAQMVGTLKSPTQRLVFALNWNLQKLVLVLKKMSEKSN